MDAQIKIKEVNISNDDRLKMEKIADYWAGQQKIDITRLLKEYQDFFRPRL